MLIQRFSLRFLFILTTTASLLSLVLMAAFRGAEWAVPIVVAVLFLALAFVHYAMLFTVVWVLTFRRRRRPPAPRSPFATDTLPRQIIPPTS
jgi:hypothetical protein